MSDLNNIEVIKRGIVGDNSSYRKIKNIVCPVSPDDLETLTIDNSDLYRIGIGQYVSCSDSENKTYVAALTGNNCVITITVVDATGEKNIIVMNFELIDSKRAIELIDEITKGRTIVQIEISAKPLDIQIPMNGENKISGKDIIESFCNKICDYAKSKYGSFANSRNADVTDVAYVKVANGVNYIKEGELPPPEKSGLFSCKK